MTIQELRTILYYVFNNKEGFLDWRVKLVKELYGNEFDCEIKLYSYKNFTYVGKRLYISKANSSKYILLTPKFTYIRHLLIPKFCSIHRVKFVYTLNDSYLVKVRGYIVKWLKSKSKKKDINWTKKKLVFKYLIGV